MFSDVELNYIKSIINTYRQVGYRYYVVHTVTERDNVVDINIYLSKNEIVANNSLSFSIEDGLFMRIDSSSRNDTNNNSVNDRYEIIDSNYNSILLINQAEFVYTNAELNYSIIEDVKQPDVLLGGVDSTDSFELSLCSVFLLTIIFCFIFVDKILNIKR